MTRKNDFLKGGLGSSSIICLDCIVLSMALKFYSNRQNGWNLQSESFEDYLLWLKKLQGKTDKVLIFLATSFFNRIIKPIIFKHDFVLSNCSHIIVVKEGSHHQMTLTIIKTITFSKLNQEFDSLVVFYIQKMNTCYLSTVEIWL